MALSATIPRGGCWSLSPHPPHYLVHKARDTITLLFPDLYALVLLSFSVSLFSAVISLLLLQTKPVFTSPASSLNYFSAQSTHLRLAVLRSDQLTRLPQSLSVGCFLSARLWVLLGRFVQQPHSPRMPGCRQTLPSTECWCEVLWIWLPRAARTGILQLLIANGPEGRVSDSTTTIPEKRGKEKVDLRSSCSHCFSSQEHRALHSPLTSSSSLLKSTCHFPPSSYCILM